MKVEDLFPEVCSVTGKGISQGFVYGDGIIIESDYDLLKVLREAIPEFNADINIGSSKSKSGYTLERDISDKKLLKFSYKNKYHYWTQWDVIDDELDQAYDEHGTLYKLKDGNWELAFDLDDYEIIGGDGVETELWEHRETKKTISIPIEIVRDFNNIDFRD
jgi:hypothetical protein